MVQSQADAVASSAASFVAAASGSSCFLPAPGKHAHKSDKHGRNIFCIFLHGKRHLHSERN